MAEFWAENQAESSSAKVLNSSSDPKPVAGGAEPPPDNPRTVISSFKRPSSLSPQSPAMHASNLAGEMLAHFRLDDYVGMGGMGAVFRGTDIRLDRHVAIKVLPPEQATNPDIVARFQHEARAAAQLDHENVARVFYVGEDRGLHFIAFEYVDGVNVRDLIHQCGPLPPHEVVNYALQMTGALVHAAAQGVVHRDIKPSNIIITRTGRAKLVDMGLARNFERRGDGGLTQDNVTLGTFDYISPEQARDPRSADMRSDIYSLGCTLFHMLTGRPPYPEGTVLQKLLKHQEESPPDPRVSNRRVPDNLAHVVLRMTAKNPTRRYQNPDELLADLLEVAATLGMKSTSPEGLIWVTDQSKSATSRLTGAIWFAAAAALVIAVIALYGRPGAAPDSAAIAPSSPAGAAATTPAQTAGTVTPDDGSMPSDTESPDEPFTEPIRADGQPLDPAKPTVFAPLANDRNGERMSVDEHQDLRAVLEAAPSGATIELSGRHQLRTSDRIDQSAGIRIVAKRLSLKAAPGTRPQIRMTYDAESVGVTDWTLLACEGAQVEIEGIHFEWSASGAELPPMSLISLESSSMVLRRCSLAQSLAAAPRDGGRSDLSTTWVAQLDGGIGLDSKPTGSQLAAEECFFLGGDGGVLLAGPARLRLDDCTVLPYRSAIVVSSAGFPPSLPADVRLNHVSFFGHGSPLVDLQFARAVVQARRVVFTHQEVAGVLARTDADSAFEWAGNDNIYHGLGSFLVGSNGGEMKRSVSSLDAWTSYTEHIHEQGSVETDKSPWRLSLAAAANTPGVELADAFRIDGSPRQPGESPPGARYVLPWGPLYSTAETGWWPHARSTEVARNDGPPLKPPSALQPPREAQRPAPATNTPGSVDPPPPKMPDVKKLVGGGAPGDSDAGAAASRGTPANAGETAATPPQEGLLIVDPTNRTAFRSVAAAVARAESGWTIEIRHSGVLREPLIELAERHVTVRSAPGFRAVIEMEANRLEQQGREQRLFDVRRGSLTLRDLDIRMVTDPEFSEEHWTVVASRGADVQLEGCTVTVETTVGLTNSLVRFLSYEMAEPMTAPMNDANPVRPQLRLRNCLIVGVGNLLRVSSGVRVRSELNNCAADLRDEFLVVSGGGERPAVAALNELDVRRSTIKARGGLAMLDGSDARPWLPRLEVYAADNVFLGGPDAAWIQVRSPRPVDELRGLLRWKGANNTYAGLETVWRLESTSGGSTFETYDWPTWQATMTAPVRDEVRADRARLDFPEINDGSRPWSRTRHHFLPLPTSASAGSAADSATRGVDITLVPAPPHER
jgi:serine/threonine-protein kinase